MRALGPQQQVRTPADTMVPAYGQRMRKWVRSWGPPLGEGHGKSPPTSCSWCPKPIKAEDGGAPASAPQRLPPEQRQGECGGVWCASDLRPAPSPRARPEELGSPPALGDCQPSVPSTAPPTGRGQVLG